MIFLFSNPTGSSGKTSSDISPMIHNNRLPAPGANGATDMQPVENPVRNVEILPRILPGAMRFRMRQ